MTTLKILSWGSTEMLTRYTCAKSIIKIDVQIKIFMHTVYVIKDTASFNPT